MAKKFHIATFGCRTNQADSAAIREDFIASDFEEVADHGEADVIILNSCTVTHRSDQQVRQLTRKMRRENPGAKVIVTGCYAQRDPAGLAKIEGVDAVVGNTRKQDLLEISVVDSGESDERQGAAVHFDDFEKIRAIDLTPATRIGGKTRPYVKIQDGCDAKCTYCIIPVVRGPGRSVPPDQIIKQVRDLTDCGYREVVLTGIHIGTYGMHMQPRHPLDRLLRDMVRIPGLGQIRISSIEPMELSKRVINIAAESNRIAPHFHICLQSGSDRILQKMLRPYTTSRFEEIVGQIREKIPHAGIGTDLIVGFPGETDEDHEKTLRFVERMPFTYLHVFPYSDRSGTPASRMKEKVRPEVIRRRSEALREVSDRKHHEFRKGFERQQVSLLTLTELKAGYREALTGNYLKARVDGSLPGNLLIQGRVERTDQEYLYVTDLAGDDLSTDRPTTSSIQLPILD